MNKNKRFSKITSTASAKVHLVETNDRTIEVPEMLILALQSLELISSCFCSTCCWEIIENTNTVIPLKFKQFQRHQIFLYFSLYLKSGKFKTENGKFEICSSIARGKWQKSVKNTLLHHIKRNWHFMRLAIKSHIYVMKNLT